MEFDDIFITSLWSFALSSDNLVYFAVICYSFLNFWYIVHGMKNLATLEPRHYGPFRNSFSVAATKRGS
jgi:hypothetical protein